IPGDEWVNKIKPYYPKGKRGRPPIGIEVMLRMYLLQIWFRLSDEGVEDVINDSYCMQRFLGINFLEQQVPDATTLLKFRHLLEKHNLGKALFEDINERLEKAGLMMRGGSIVDATIIESTASTKNKEGKRDPEMHQTKKGNQWHHGMKVHVAVDCGSGLTHTIEGTPANVADIDEAAKLLRPDDETVYGDAGYAGLESRPEIKENANLSKIDFRINRKPSKLNISKDYRGINWEKFIEHRKSSVRCKVEHVFLIVKRQFGYSKTAYRGIAKNMNRFYMLFGCANLLMCIRGGRTQAFRSVCLG
ncbi:MAG: IS5 family transposase, partial [Bacteroidaceae bacterium]|nr:IS5 family transposase [Bacteroidaceae bacterium]